MPKTLQEIADACGTSSVAEAIIDDYVVPDDFEDPDLYRICGEIQAGLRHIENVLEEYLP